MTLTPEQKAHLREIDRLFPRKPEKDTNPSVTRSFPVDPGDGWNPGSSLIVTARVSVTNHRYFSVTGEISTAQQRRHGNAQCCGCIHDEILKAWPEIAPIIRLHLSDAETGAPMHWHANGLYWFAGIHGGLGEQYHGGIDKTVAECRKICAEYLRVSESDIDAIAPDKTAFAAFADAQRERWQREAAEGIALLESLKA